MSNFNTQQTMLQPLTSPPFSPNFSCKAAISNIGANNRGLANSGGPGGHSGGPGGDSGSRVK